MQLSTSLTRLSEDQLPQVFGGIRDGGRRRAYRPVVKRASQPTAFPLETLSLEHGAPLTSSAPSPFFEIIKTKTTSLQTVPEPVLALVSAGLHRTGLASSVIHTPSGLASHEIFFIQTSSL